MSDSLLTRLPLDFHQDHEAILGMTGAGKSYTARGAVEQLLDDGRRWVGIDPTGVWWGIRLMADGKTPSPYQVVIFGGDHADVPLEGVSGERLADAIAEGSFSAVIDTTRLTVSARTKLFTDFAERLAAVNRRRLHLTIDEAHLFAPQGRVNDPRSGQMLHAANNLVSGGRALGLRIMLISQRPAKLHKDSLTQAKALVALQVIHPLDRKAIGDWMKDNGDPALAAEIVNSLAGLETGSGWVWAPRLQLLERARFGPIATFDSMRAPEDDADRQPVHLQTLDLDELRAALQAEPPSATSTKKRTGTAPILAAPALIAEEIDAARAAGRRVGLEEGLARGLEAGYGTGFSAGLHAAIDALGKVKPDPNHRQPTRENVSLMLLALGETAKAAEPEQRPAPPQVAAPEPRSTTMPTPGAMPIASAVMLQAARRAPWPLANWEEAALLAGITPGGGYFNTLRKALRSGGHDQVPGNDDNAQGPLRSAADLRTLYEGKLSVGRLNAVGRLFGVLWENGRMTQVMAAEIGGLTMGGGYWNSVRKSVRSSPLFSTPDDASWDIAPVLRRLKEWRA